VVPIPGDVINTESHPKFYEVHLWILKKGIRWHQRSLGFANWRHTHTMLYLNDRAIFSCTWPHCKWETWEKVSKSDYDIYRPRFLSHTETEEARMWAAASEMIGTHYDGGQLLDIALNSLLGYGVGKWQRFCDWGAKLKVCSVAVRAIFEALRQRGKLYACAGGKRIEISEPFPKLFGGLHVERTTPAHFANSPEEFTVIGREE
jgi:hypothetical protein